MDTWRSIGSVFNLDYLESDQIAGTLERKREVIRTGMLLQELEGQGYTFGTVQSDNIFLLPSLLDVEMKYALSKDEDGRTSVEMMVSNTALYPFAQAVGDFVNEWLSAGSKTT